MPAYPQMPDPRRITGLYGGTFDPVHRGHLHVIDQLLEGGHIAQCICIPAHQNPLKIGRHRRDGRHRLAMLECVAAEHPHLFVSDVELRRAGLSYTITTVEHFRGTYGDRLRLILGADSLETLPRWYAAHRLIARVQPLIYARPGADLPDLATLRRTWPDALARRLHAGYVFGPPSAVSATAIRADLAAGKDCTALLSPAVRHYITAHALYQGDA